MNPNIWKHFKTITEHKILVMKYCFSVGLYRQGLLHDLSKYGPQEFLAGVFFYQGNRSPNSAEREIRGYSSAWLHHKGRNKHHFEYWIDFSNKREEGLIGNKMPLKYVIEMVMDRIAASRTYEGEHYTSASSWNYYCIMKDVIVIHPDTRRLLEKLLLMLRDEGEEQTFRYIKRLLKRNNY